LTPSHPSKKRQQIVDTGTRLFSRHGVRRITVEELCREAGVSRVTFYKYFANKDALAREIVDTWIDAGFAAFDEICARDIPFPQKIDAMTQWKVDFARRIDSEFFREMSLAEDVAEEFKRRYVANVAAAQTQGEVRADVHPEVLWLLVEKLESIYHERRWVEVVPDLSELTRQFRTLLWYGLLVRPEEGGTP
jgi:AcrR family transcriptional regulator